MTTPEPVTDAIAKQVAEIRSEFDLGGYFSDRSHTEKAKQLLDALADQLRAALAATPEPVTGATQDDDARIDAVAEFVRQQFGSRSDSPVALAGHRLIARRFIAASDAADAAAGIRRVTLDEAIERAAKVIYEQYAGARWNDATERQRRGPRDEVRPMVTAAFGAAS